MEKCSAHPATVENLDFPHKNISGWLKILTCGSHCPQKLWDRSLASAVRHRYGIRNVSGGFAALVAAVGRAGAGFSQGGFSPRWLPPVPPSPSTMPSPRHRRHSAARGVGAGARGKGVQDGSAEERGCSKATLTPKHSQPRGVQVPLAGTRSQPSLPARCCTRRGARVKASGARARRSQAGKLGERSWAEG